MAAGRSVYVAAARHHRLSALRRTAARHPDVTKVVVGPTLDGVRQRTFDLIVLDQTRDNPEEFVPFDRLSRTCRTLVTTESASRVDSWMARGCGSRGVVTDATQLSAAIDVVLAGGEFWPVDLGAEPGWLRQPIISRLCGYLRQRERTWLARQLHDHTLQIVETMLRDASDLGPPARDRLSEEAVRLRRFVDSMTHPPAPSLRREIEQSIEYFRGHGLAITLSGGRHLRRPLPDRVVAPMAGAVHEALRNAVKHARAETATVTVSVTEGRFEMCVTDDGAGFDPRQTWWGFGITESINARLAEVSGKTEIRSAPGEGTVVTVSVPVDAEPNDWCCHQNW